MTKAILTIAAVLLAYAAFDDITTDHDTNFVFERAMVALCVGWLAWVTWQCIAERRRALSLVSVVLLAGAVLAQPRVVQGPQGSVAAYLVTLACLVWFLGVAVWLAVRARRTRG
jgi:hypothetical protein